ncbi:hypothetical protein NE237_001425 [Protea cynaroides]|uniref:Uncharacterized protein n=1 Tax=Protea cynaroides TaxID=273540 RepID=A0A9Q0QYF1_9MAGN|nr:hypothetical protein NE237_001425 [Protea cynaroides]
MHCPYMIKLENDCRSRCISHTWSINDNFSYQLNFLPQWQRQHKKGKWVSETRDTQLCYRVLEIGVDLVIELREVEHETKHSSSGWEEDVGRGTKFIADVDQAAAEKIDD